MGSISAPMSNTASLSNRGLELNLGWNDQIKDFRYGVGINLAFNKNRVTDFKGELRYELDEDVKDIWGNPTMRYTNLADVSTGGDTRRVEGHMIDEFFSCVVLIPVTVLISWPTVVLIRMEDLVTV